MRTLRFIVDVLIKSKLISIIPNSIFDRSNSHNSEFINDSKTSI